MKMKFMYTGVILCLCVVSSLAWWKQESEPMNDDETELPDGSMESMESLGEPDGK